MLYGKVIVILVPFTISAMLSSFRARATLLVYALIRPLAPNFIPPKYRVTIHKI